MPITPFLEHEAFDPEATRAMGIAFENSCKALGLADRADPITGIIAKKIIELTRSGIRDSARLQTEILKTFKDSAE